MSAKNSRLSIINNTKYCIMDLPALLKEIFPVGLFLPKCTAAALFGGILAANWLIVFIILVFTLLALLCSEFVRNFLRTLPRDVKGYLRLRRLQSEMESKWAEGKSIGEHFLSVVERHPQKTAIIEAETGRSLDFQSLDQLANKFGNFFLAEFKDQNAESPTVVGLLVGNCVEFVALWLGLSRAGLISAWLNTQLRGQSLAHSLMIADCGAVVTTEELLPALLEVLDANKSKQMRVFVLNPRKREKCTTLIKPLLADQLADDSEPIPPKKIGFQDVLAFLFTSGTTGQPKAVIIRHHRFYFMGAGGRIIYGIRPSDRLYCTLPMFHGMAGIASVGQMVVNGSSIVIRSKFSASHFWSDCLRFRCTVGIYIGEICRYLLGQPRTQEEGQHRIRLLCGLGLRPSLWEAFGIRFGIHQIGELYGATEGNATCVNLDYEMGACGFLPTLTAFMAHTSIRLVKLDPESGEYVRKRDGLCVLCMPGESGEIVGMIREGNPTRRFEGYLERAETEKKLLHNVESVGDCAFASGDILHWDRRGYLFFKDRRGDSYRWKGENVSSSEVESLLLEDQRIGDLAVFGVPVPGQEGKAGMCALALAHATQEQEEEGEEDADEELEALVAHIGHKFRQNLAPFAIPLFLRICPGGLERTGTFKLKKAKLQAQGLLPVDGQTQFVWDRRRSEYARFETDGWEMHVI